MDTSVFQSAYNQLNSSQKSAVDSIDGVVMVIAGPGSGKTQLLSIRAANILLQTDINPGSLLCLTFTESAATNMRERISSLVGSETSSKIRIQTFHAFASDIINQNRSQFEEISDFTPISQFDYKLILRDLILSLPFNTKLKSRHPKLGYIYLKEVGDRISELKRAGLSPTQFEQLHSETLEFCSTTQAELSELLKTITPASSKTTINEIIKIVLAATDSTKLPDYTSLRAVALDHLSAALIAVDNLQPRSQSKPLTKFRDTFFTKTESGLVWNYLDQKSNWQDILQVYKLYTKKMHDNAWIDFDDMLLLATQKLESDSDFLLRYQEQFQYIMVDEFQDNNKVQSKLVELLGNNPINEQNPNILVVGDDDQAIYKFGGAHLNILEQFASHYPRIKHITLSTNYRSTKVVVDFANTITTQITSRFDTKKQIEPNQNSKHTETEITCTPYENELLECRNTTLHIKKLIDSGVAPDKISVIARGHKNLLPLFNQLVLEHIPVSYERSNSILELPGIPLILTILKYITGVVSPEKSPMDELLPNILSSPVWGIERVDIWKTSIAANRGLWLEAMLNSDSIKIKQIAQFLLALGIQKNIQNAQEILATIIGTEEIELENNVYFTSPIKQYFFKTEEILNTKSKHTYNEFLHGIRTLYNLTEEYKSAEFITAQDLAELIEHASALGVAITDTVTVKTSEQAVQLLTAHKSKGLEFEYVFLINATQEEWFPTRKRPTKLKWPQHMNFSPLGDDVDDITRILYVAVTRAKQFLHISHSTNSIKGKNHPVHLCEGIPNQLPLFETVIQDTITEVITFPSILPANTNQEYLLLKERAKTISLSASTFTSFLDLAHGGPNSFIENTLLRFPKASSTSAKLGNVIHSILEKSLIYLTTKHLLPSIEWMIEQLPELIKKERIRKDEWIEQTQKATAIIESCHASIMKHWGVSDIAEQNFNPLHLVWEGVSITGKIDRLGVNNTTVTIYDYKTGKPLSARTKSDKEWQIKKYNYQFYFYVLLLEQSGLLKQRNLDIAGVEFQFISGGDVIENYTASIDPLEYLEFKKLLSIVHSKIVTLDIPSQDMLQHFANKEGEFDSESSIKFVEWLLANG
jgi:DNA helicase II / ATP-dependent DNA helicase PcrA